MCPFYGPNWLPAAQYPVSGYHMAVVAGIVFFVVRAILALIPGLADRAPIKKWAALAALIVTAFYLVLSGAEVAT
jgi:competence protein ComEC